MCRFGKICLQTHLRFISERFLLTNAVHRQRNIFISALKN